MIDLKKLLSVPYVDPYIGFDISPDSTKVAFSWNPIGQWEIYELPLDGSKPPWQVTSGPGGKFAPKYSPDGTRLAYSVDFNGSENYHIFVHDLASGGHTDLTPEIDYALQPHFDWSPDGKEIAFLANRTGCFSTYVMPASSGTERLLFDNGCPAWNVSWSPDGRWLAVQSQTIGQDHGIFIVPTQVGDAIQISDESSPLNAHNPCWSPDGTRLVFCCDQKGVYDIAIYHVASKSVTWITSGEGEKTHPDWSPDGERLAYIYSHGAETRLSVQKPGETPETHQVEPGIHFTPKFTPDGKQVIFVFDNPRHPDDLWTLWLSDGTFYQLTDSLPDELADSAFVMPQEIWYPGLDGENIPALLYQPANADKHAPAVVTIHGGPNWLFQFTWNPLMTHLASRGWVVLSPNYRGSTGYGRNWQIANRFDLGGVDTRDVAAGAMYLASQGLADPARIAVTGRSHGGYLTMTCLTQYPDLWVAGSAVVPFLNWFTAHANSRDDLQHWDIENLGDPEDNHDLWYEHSPFFFLDRVCVPVQLICGANDPRCPASESTEARDKLLALGREVDFVLYQDEGHAFLKIENVVSSEVRRVSFLARALES